MNSIIDSLVHYETASELAFEANHAFDAAKTALDTNDVFGYLHAQEKFEALSSVIGTLIGPESVLLRGDQYVFFKSEADFIDLMADNA